MHETIRDRKLGRDPDGFVNQASIVPVGTRSPGIVSGVDTPVDLDGGSKLVLLINDSITVSAGTLKLYFKDRLQETITLSAYTHLTEFAPVSEDALHFCDSAVINITHTGGADDVFLGKLTLVG